MVRISRLIFNPYSYLKASIGLRLAALRAGYQPKKIPMIVQTANEIMIEEGVTTVRHPATAVINRVMSKPLTIPITPATRLITNASIKSCHITSAEVAPMARRVPISRVRSVTDTNMIFMIPIPPTNSDILATLANRMVSTLVTPCTLPLHQRGY